MGILYTLYNKVNGCYEETNKNRYLMLVPINENKETIKKIWRTMEYIKKFN